MAMGIKFVCSDCGKGIESWSDGNPYFIDANGKKRHCYHPADDHLLEKCIGNDVPYICLDCGREFESDTREPRTECPKCRSADICDSYKLDGKKCPYCGKGPLALDPDWRAIS